ncbi:MAG: type IX secretion system sortase PorU [FCB group bacterium]|nr:type IX secretion system sortase PorU [FCB group bacterium]
MSDRSALKSIIKSTAYVLGVLLLVSSLMAGSSSRHTDVTISRLADDNLVVTYHPDLSGDFTGLGQADLIELNGAQFWGRTLLVALPPDGDLDFNYNYSTAGTVDQPVDDRFVSAMTPLVIRGRNIEARGRRIARLHVFPQRLENGRLTAFTDFEINVDIRPGLKTDVVSGASSRLDSVLASSVINSDMFFEFGRADRKLAAFKPSVGMFDEDAHWVKITVDEDGVTRITGSQLEQAGIGLTGLMADSLRLFYSGGNHPSIDPTDPEPELYQVGVRVEDGGDGQFGGGDYILFYAEGAEKYDLNSGSPIYQNDPYGRINVYWLAVGGFADEVPLRWPVEMAAPVGTPDYFVDVTRQPIRLEQEAVLYTDIYGRIRDYYQWYWSALPTVSASINLPNLVSGDSVGIEMTAICNYSGTKIYLNGVEMIYSGGKDFYDISGAAYAGLNTFQVNLSPSGTYTYLDYLNISYPMKLHLSGDQLEFNSLGYAGQLRYQLTGYTPSQYSLNISNPDEPILISGVEITGDTARFQLPANPLAPSCFVVYSLSNVEMPLSIETVQVGSLRNDPGQYDCIVVSPRGFQGALGEYVDYRGADGYRIKLAALEDIYNEFGFGLESPIAIRCYLKYAYENFESPAPMAVLLAGDGHYDYIDNLNMHTPSYVPPFIWSRASSLGDDNYVYFGKVDSLDSDSSYNYPEDRGWDMMVARWPVRSSAEVAAYINKLKIYEADENRGSWRSRITFVADDEFKKTTSSEIIHTAQAETLAVMHTPVEFVKQKIYLTEYPFAASGEKPSVNDAIVKAVNEGTLIVNYIGHGSPDVWADEHVLKKASDLSRMQNEDKPTVVIAASCSIGFFDAPDKEGMAEMMFRQTGGAIATVSATRLVYSTDNSIFNYDLYDALFDGHQNICEAVYSTKMMHQFIHNSSLVRNDRAYLVFGDPLGRLGLPEYRLEIEADGAGELIPLQYFSFNGRVINEEGNPAVVEGLADMAVYDSPIIRQHNLGISYSLGGPTLFRGPIQITDGEFSGGFIVPLDIDYGGDDALISGYCSFGDISAIGGLDSLIISETVSPTTDNSGPDIKFSFEENPEFVSGDRISANATMILELSDPMGLNLTGGLGHRIELTFDNDNNTTVNLTGNFAYDRGSYQAGQLRYTLPDLSAELHQFKVRAWDNANNPALVEFDALISEESRIALTDVMNYPNPMTEWTEFYFELSESASWVELQIFTLAGRMIKRFYEDNPEMGRNRMFYWDGRDLDGDRIAEGVYIYKLTAGGQTVSDREKADNKTETFGKLVLLN